MRISLDKANFFSRRERPGQAGEKNSVLLRKRKECQ